MTTNRWDPELDGPAWLDDPALAAEALAEILRDYWYKMLSGYFDRRESAQEALKRINPDCHRRDWVRVGMALKHEFGEEGWLLWDSWSRRGEKYDPGTIREQWDSFRDNHANPVTLGTILHLAKEAAHG